MQGQLDSAKKHEKRVKACERRKKRNNRANNFRAMTVSRTIYSIRWRIVHFTVHVEPYTSTFCQLYASHWRTVSPSRTRNPILLRSVGHPTYIRRSTIEASDGKEKASSSRYALVVTYQEMAKPYRPPYPAKSRPRKPPVHYISVSSDNMYSDASL